MRWTEGYEKTEVAHCRLDIFPSKVTQRSIHPRSIFVCLIHKSFEHNIIRSLKFVYPRNRRPMCVRYILKKNNSNINKNYSRGSCNSIKDIRYLKKVACIIIIIIICIAIISLSVGIILQAYKQSFLALIIPSGTCLWSRLSLSYFPRQKTIWISRRSVKNLMSLTVPSVCTRPTSLDLCRFRFNSCSFFELWKSKKVCKLTVNVFFSFPWLLS